MRAAKAATSAPRWLGRSGAIMAMEEVAAGRLVFRVRHRPFGAPLGLAQRLLLPGRDPLEEGVDARLVVRVEAERPGADQGLVEHLLRAHPRRRPVGEVLAQAGVEPRPAVHHRRPLVRDLGQHGDARARVLAALVVVRRGGEQRAREVLRPRPRRGVEAGGRDREAARIGADLVARDAGGRSGRRPCPPRSWPRSARRAAGSAPRRPGARAASPAAGSAAPRRRARRRAGRSAAARSRARCAARRPAPSRGCACPRRCARPA